MVYIYDILLNFNNDFYEFYEWEKSDYIYHIKKTPIIKVDANFLDDLLTKKIIIDDPITYTIQNKTELFDNKKTKTLKYVCLLTDTYRVIGILLNDDFSVSKVSDLMLDEALDAIDISRRCNFSNITYNIVGTRKDNIFLTRNEIKIKKYLLSEIKNAYHDNDRGKLEYLYFEYFNKVETDIDKIVIALKESLTLEVNDNHKKIYELLKLANSRC